MATSSPSSWVVLHKPDVRVSADQGGKGFSLSRASAPLLSHIDVSSGSAAGLPQPLRVIAADPSAGLFLLPGPARRRNAPRGRAYTVLSTANTNVSHYVPGRDVAGPDPDPTSLGIIRRGRNGAGFMVVGIECDMVDSTKAWLHYYSDETLRWGIKRVHNPMPHPHRATAFDGVIAHGGRVWWVHAGSDTGGVSGLLSCDPFAQYPQMLFYTSPELRGFCPRADCFHVPRVARRCVQVAGGKIRWVQILCYHMEERWPSLQRSAAPTVLVLTLDDQHTGEWSRAEEHHRLSLDDVWASDAYLDTCLPAEEPALAFIDPTDPDVLYFSLTRYFFAVDMRSKQVVGSRRHHHGKSNSDVHSSSLIPWVPPPALRLTVTAPEASSPHHRQDQAAAGEASGSSSSSGGVKSEPAASSSGTAI